MNLIKKEFTPYNGDAQFGNVESFVLENITDVFKHGRIELPHVERFEGKLRRNNDGIILLFAHYKNKNYDLVGSLGGFTLEEVEILNEQVDCLVSREVFDEIVRHSMLPKKYFTYPLMVLLTFTSFFVKAQNGDLRLDSIIKFDNRNVFTYKEPPYMSVSETKTVLSKLGCSFILATDKIWLYFTAKIIKLDYKTNEIQVNAETCITLNFTDEEFDNYLKQYQNSVGELVHIRAMILYKESFGCTQFKNVTIESF